MLLDESVWFNDWTLESFMVQFFFHIRNSEHFLDFGTNSYPADNQSLTFRTHWIGISIRNKTNRERNIQRKIYKNKLESLQLSWIELNEALALALFQLLRYTAIWHNIVRWDHERLHTFKHWFLFEENDHLDEMIALNCCCGCTHTNTQQSCAKPAS